MKLGCILLSFLTFVFTNSSALATEYNILGKGIENRRTHEIIAIACVGKPTAELPAESNCSQIQALYYKPNAEAPVLLIGSVHGVSENDKEPTKAELKKEYREIAESFHDYRFHNLNHRWHWVSIINATVGVGSWIGIGAALIGGTVFWPFGVAFAASVALIPVDNYIYDRVFVNTTLTKFSNQDGWNWSVEPKKISNRKFKELHSYFSY